MDVESNGAVEGEKSTFLQSSVDFQVFMHANNTLISEELPLMERKVVKMRNGRFSIVWSSYNAQIQHIRSVYDTIGAPCFYLLHSCKLLGLVLKVRRS